MADDPLPLPHRPPRQEPPSFPTIGVIAPLAVAAVLFAITRTPEMLLFGLFTPVLAVAALLDGRRAVRRRRRADEAAYAIELAAVESELRMRLEQRGAAARRAHPRSAHLAETAADWRTHPPAGVLLLGHADLPTGPIVTGRAADDRSRHLLERGRLLPGAPVTVPLGTSVMLQGEPALVEGASRALAVQRARAGGPLEAPVARDGADLVLALDGVRSARIVGTSAPLLHLDGLRFAPDLLSRAAHDSAAAVLGGSTGDAAPLDSLLSHPAPPGGLAARFLLDGIDPVDIDLVEHGPHAVVGGTTGSGKSALLTAWVLALAAAQPAGRIAMLLVDCKGGAAFDRLRGLPGVVGVVTDLDDEGAERAVRSLVAEVRRRERALRSAGAADVTATDLPRLVIVVDEFRVLLERWPDLAPVFVDVAARGRSLGIHLVLCTQRPIGSMRSELLTNCALRIALRVNDVDDSVTLVGSEAAARLPHSPAGGVVVALPGEEPLRCRVATVDPSRVAAAVDRIAAASIAGAGDLAPPWLEPLPADLPEDRLPGASADGAVVFGLLDLPDEQRQPPAEWLPGPGRALLILGGARTGRTSTLALLGARLGAAARLSDDPAVAWEQLHDDATPLLVDDLPVLLAAFGERHTQAALDRLATRLRSPSAAPTVLALPGPSAWGGLRLRPLVGLCDEVLLLGLPLEDHLACGGSRSTWSPKPRPGAGTYRGARVQVARTRAPLPATPRSDARRLSLDTGRWLLVTGASQRRTAELEAVGVPVIGAETDSSGVVVASVDDLQRSWALFQRIRARAGLLLDGVGAVDARSLTGRAELLPPVSHEHEVLLVPAEGAVERRRLCGIDGAVLH